ncbi:MAG TPA: AsmA family protein [Deltaproteobacteria bacterium]|nr:AsmA family protein [Deltaproteobacteria bacterium]
MKKIIIGGLIFLLVLVVAAVLAPFFVDLNKYRETIITKAEEVLHREVDFHNISLTILGGIGAEIGGLRISDNPDFSSEDFISLESFKVRLEILPLLTKEIKVRKIVLNRPYIHVQRNEAGLFNFDDLLNRQHKGPEASAQKPPLPEARKAPKKEPVKDAPSPALAVFIVKELVISDGKLVFDDKMLFRDRPPVVIDDLDLDMDDISFDHPMGIDLKASLLGAKRPNLRFFGTIGPIGSVETLMKTPFDLNLNSDGLSLGNLPVDLPLTMDILSGEVHMKISASGSLADRVVSDIRVTVGNLVLEERSGSSGPGRTGMLNFDLAGVYSLEFPSQRLDIESGYIEMNGNRISFKGTAGRIMSDPSWDMTASAKNLDPAGMVKLLPMYAALIPQGLVFSGPMEFSLVSDKNEQGINLEAETDMKGMQISYGDVFHKPLDIPLSLAFDGNMNQGIISASSLRFVLHNLLLGGSGSVDTSSEVPNLSIDLKTQPITLKGWERIVPVIKEYDLEGVAEVTAGVSGPLDDLSMNLKAACDTAGFVMPESGEASGSNEKTRAVLRGTNVDIKARRKNEILSGSASAGVHKGTIRDVVFEDFSGQALLTPDALTVQSFGLKVFNGSIKGAGRYVLETGKWSAAPVFEGIASGTLLDTLTSYKGIFSGMFSGTFQLNGLAKEPGINALDAEGSFALNNGQLKNLDLAGAVMDDFYRIQDLADKAGVSREKIDRHETTSFDLLDATFSMSKGMLAVNPLNLKNVSTSRSTDSHARLAGVVDMNTRALDLKGDVILSRKQSVDLIKRTPVLSALLDNQESIVFPVRIKGSLVKPLVNIDTKIVNEALARYYSRQGVKKLQEKLGIPGGNQGTEEAVDQLLRGIFGN